ncbi:MAG: hypothetical protein K9J16_09190 [Melioribacteraceae bacterium]|nr:hypothetical protein [Melioribacteraceae bacterium]MCF8353219.1 hypothetical protein [Melioribacteraceae bacterium]MCF8395610.1 hypothetical protein [Melioribacteraceae bacterium]MCF8418747.1 hypothetical protein [Melioribacteraceae bacterium]
MKIIINFLTLICVVSFAIFTLFLISEDIITSEEIDIVIQSIERIDNGEYLVKTRGSIYSNSDNFFHSKPASDSMSVLLRKKAVHKVRVVGYNFRHLLPFLSPYKNIVEIVDEPVDYRKLMLSINKSMD